MKADIAKDHADVPKRGIKDSPPNVHDAVC